jgi:hypothetical protein
METTKQIPHPNFPDFKTTIRYISRAAILKQQAKLERKKKPIVVLDPSTGKAYIQTEGPEKGQPLVIYKADISDDFAIDNLLEYVAGFEGHPDGVSFAPATVETLFDPRFDVPIERDIEEDGATVKKTVNASWATALQIKAYDRATFDADPSAPASEKQ